MLCQQQRRETKMLDYRDWICEQEEDADTSFEAYQDYLFDAADNYFGMRDGL